MNYKITNTINHIYGFFVCNNTLYYGREEGDQCFIHRDEHSYFYTVNGKLSNCLVFNDIVYFNTSGRETYLLKNNLDIELWDSTWKMGLFNFNICNPNFVCCYSEDNNIQMKKIYNLELKEFAHLDFEIDFIYQNHLLKFIYLDKYYNKFSFEAIDCKSGISKWKFHLSTFPKYPGITNEVEVRKFMGVYNGILWVGLTNLMIVGIDVETGLEIHCILYPAIELPIAQKLRIKKGIRRTPHGLSFGFLDDKVGKIIHIYESFYFELDLTTLQAKHQDLSPQLQGTRSHGLANMISFDDKFMYYIDGANNSVGVVNRETLQVEWQHDFKQTYNTRPIELKHEGYNLYILDSENTLRVFESENDVV